jgi:hypothetical protein
MPDIGTVQIYSKEYHQQEGKPECGHGKAYEYGNSSYFYIEEY